MPTQWPGEKLGLFDVVPLAGGHTSGGLRQALRVDDATGATVTLTAGDSFYVYSDAPRLMVESDTVSAATWALVVDSGEAAAHFDTAYDLNWSYGDLAWSPETAVSLTAGRALLPLPDADRTYGRLRTDGAPLLRVTVTAGTVTVSSLYLQVEPPGGLQRADGWVWSDWANPAEVALNADIGGATVATGALIEHSLNREDALAVARAGGNRPGAASGSSIYPLLVSGGRVDTPALGDVSTLASAYDRSLLEPNPSVPGDGNAYAFLQVGYGMAFWRQRADFRTIPADLVGGFTAGRDIVLDPAYNRFNDWRAWGEFSDEPTVATRWADVVLDVTRQGSMPGVSANVGFLTGAVFADATASGGELASWPPPTRTDFVLDGAVIAPNVSTFIELGFPPAAAGADFTMVAATHLFTGEASPVDDAWVDYIDTKMAPTIWHQMPAFRWRVPVFSPDPDAVAATPRFFVKDDTDVRMRPVGFGKPATETRVFRVPGGGRWRDLTAAEYAVHGPGNRPVGGMALKVKRQDDAGTAWWDHVGWMVPD